MKVLKLAAFSQNGQGGNPAGVAFYDAMPSDEEMLRIAKEVGYSETAFLVKHPQEDGWRVRYFTPSHTADLVHARAQIQRKEVNSLHSPSGAHRVLRKGTNRHADQLSESGRGLPGLKLSRPKISHHPLPALT